MIRRRAVLGGIAGAFTLGACSRMDSMGLPELQGGAPLGLKSSGKWTFLTIKPPYIIGPDHSMRLEGGALKGTIIGTSVDVRIGKDRATGMTGPRPVQLDIVDEQDRFELTGTWDGATVRLTAEDGKLEATIPILRQDYYVSTTFVPSASRPYCDFRLREKDPQHLFGRTSCGFNTDVQLEIAPQIQGWLSRSELGVVLVALMSTAQHG